VLTAPGAGDVIELGNEFAQVRVSRVETRNGSRLLIESPKSGQWVALCPLELEALTWQGHELFSALLRTPHGPEDEPGDEPREFTDGKGDLIHRFRMRPHRAVMPAAEPDVEGRTDRFAQALGHRSRAGIVIDMGVIALDPGGLARLEVGGHRILLD